MVLTGVFDFAEIHPHLTSGIKVCCNCLLSSNFVLRQKNILSQNSYTRYTIQLSVLDQFVVASTAQVTLRCTFLDLIHIKSHSPVPRLLSSDFRWTFLFYSFHRAKYLRLTWFTMSCFFTLFMSFIYSTLTRFIFEDLQKVHLRIIELLCSVFLSWDSRLPFRASL